LVSPGAVLESVDNRTRLVERVDEISLLATLIRFARERSGERLFVGVLIQVEDDTRASRSGYGKLDEGYLRGSGTDVETGGECGNKADESGPVAGRG